MASKSTNGPLDEFTRRPAMRILVFCPDLHAARSFYEETLGCRIASASDDLLVFEFFGGRLYIQRGAGPAAQGISTGIAEFGLEMGWEDWHRAVDHLNYIGVRYAASPSISARGTPQEAAHFSIEDPGGNRLGFTSSRESAKSEKQGA